MIYKTLLLNCQDLYVFLDKYQNEDLNSITNQKWQQLTASFYENKELNKLLQIVELVKIKSPDIFALVEVGGEESLSNLNRYFLNDDFQVFHAPSNSNRGIDIGFLVKKKIAKHFSLNHYNNTKLNNGKVFSRGLLSLNFKIKNENYSFNLCHLKSKLNKDGSDFEGRSQRQAEVAFIVQNSKERMKENPKLNLAYMGDFNGIIYKESSEEELRPLTEKAQLRDILDFLDYPLEERSTYFYFDKQEKARPMQLDYVLINPSFQNKIIPENSYICSFEGTKHPLYPNSRDERNKLPSDHFPIYFEFKDS